MVVTVVILLLLMFVVGLSILLVAALVDTMAGPTTVEACSIPGAVLVLVIAATIAALAFTKGT